MKVSQNEEVFCSNYDLCRHSALVQSEIVLNLFFIYKYLHLPFQPACLGYFHRQLLQNPREGSDFHYWLPDFLIVAHFLKEKIYIFNSVIARVVYIRHQ